MSCENVVDSVDLPAAGRELLFTIIIIIHQSDDTAEAASAEYIDVCDS